MINAQGSRVQVNLKPIFDDILRINLNQSVISICLASISNDKILKFERLQLEYRLLVKFRNVVENNFKRLKKDSNKGNLLIHKYDAGSKLYSHEIEYINLSNYNFIQAQIASLSALTDMDIFAANPNFIASLRFYVVVIQQQTEPVYCFRIYSKKKELSRSKGITSLLVDNYLRCVKEPVFLFDEYIDCISRGSDLFILRKGNFHKIFHFFDTVVQTAETTLEQIKAQIDIVNFNEFDQICKGHFQMMSKLKNIASKPYLNKINLIHIKKVIKKYNMPIEIIMQNGIEKLVFDPSNKWMFLRLLDDDYLESLMTNQSYEVSGKRLY